MVTLAVYDTTVIPVKHLLTRCYGMHLRWGRFWSSYVYILLKTLYGNILHDRMRDIFSSPEDPKIREVDGAQKAINRQFLRWVYRAGSGKVFRVLDRRRRRLAESVSEGSEPEIPSRDTTFAGFLSVAPSSLSPPGSRARTLLYL